MVLILHLVQEMKHQKMKSHRGAKCQRFNLRLPLQGTAQLIQQ